MITNIQMSNFKSWIATGNIELAPLTGFFGTNSSGKSSLLQMLLLLKQTIESNDRNLVLQTGNVQEGYVNLGTTREITYGNAAGMTLGVGWQLQTPIKVATENQEVSLKTMQYEVSIHTGVDAIYVDTLSYTAPDFAATMQRQTRENYRVYAAIKGQEIKRQAARPFRNISRPVKCYGFSEEALRYYQGTGFLTDIVYDFEQQFRRVYYLGPLREYPQRFYSWSGERPADVGLKGQLAVPALLAAKSERVYRGKQQKRTTLEKRIAEWLVEMGLAASFTTRALQEDRSLYEVRLRRHEGSPEVLITDLGFGVSQVLPVLVLCYYAPPGSTIILEQPEIHLHPSAQLHLADVFIDVIKHRNIQLIIESHSEHLLRRLQRRLAEEQLQQSDVALYFCDVERGHSTIERLEIDQFGSIDNWPRDFFGDLTGDLFATAQRGIQRQLSNGKA